MTKRQRSPDRISRKRPTGDYEVGYCKPPKDTQFQPGKPGNPKGRPKRSRNLKTVLEEALREAITIREGDRKRKLSRLDVFVRSVLNDTLKGNAKAVGNLIALFRLAGLGGEEPEAPENAPTRSEDEAVLREFLRRHGAASADACDDPHNETSDDHQSESNGAGEPSDEKEESSGEDQ
jgi:hypothetical protein